LKTYPLKYPNCREPISQERKSILDRICHRIYSASLGTLLRQIHHLDFLALRNEANTIWTWSQRILYRRIYQENKRMMLYDWNSIGRIVIGKCYISHTSYSRANTMAVLKGYFMHVGMVLVQRIT